MTANPWANRRPLLVAHRGGAREAPENTLSAFEHGLACGADMLELDLRATADGEVVVLHDETLDRTTDGTGPVAERTLSEVAALDAAYWFVPGAGATDSADHYLLRGSGAARVPTLVEVLEAFPDVWMTMELKVDGLVGPVAGLLDAYGRAEDVIVGSFSTVRLEQLRSHAPHAATSASEPEVAAFWRWAHGAGSRPDALPYVALQAPLRHEGVEVVTPAFVERAHDCGVPVHAWTIDDPEVARRLLDFGVDAIMTDRPSALSEVVVGYHLGRPPSYPGSTTEA